MPFQGNTNSASGEKRTRYLTAPRQRPLPLHCGVYPKNGHNQHIQLTSNKRPFYAQLLRLSVDATKKFSALTNLTAQVLNFFFLTRVKHKLECLHAHAATEGIELHTSRSRAKRMPTELTLLRYFINIKKVILTWTTKLCPHHG